MRHGACEPIEHFGTPYIFRELLGDLTPHLLRSVVAAKAVLQPCSLPETRHRLLVIGVVLAKMMVEVARLSEVLLMLGNLCQFQGCLRCPHRVLTLGDSVS